LAACGIGSSVDVQPGPTFFDDSRDGTIFGRKFDLAIFGWLIGTVPTCEHYLSSEITGLPEQGFAGFRGANITGFFNEEYDLACETARGAFFNTPEYVENHQQALAIFDTQRPSIPLFTRPMFTLAAPNVRNIQLDPTEPSGLWNIFEWDVEQ
jgi:peptide/nickel transport system substrate-binding protein